MTEVRSVAVRLSADVSQYIANMQKAGTVGAGAMTQVERAGKGGADSMTKVEKSSSSASKALDGLGINAGTVALAVGATVVTATANFESAMSKVQAATHETEAGMDSLRDAALEAGAETSFSASEAAAGIENLAKAGLTTQDILDGGLTGALDLAAAGELAVADAAEAAAGALAQFKLEGDQAVHVADLLAAGAGKAQGDVSDMVLALKQAGTVASQTGLSLEETVGSLSAMAEQSLLGSDAGTSFKTMLAALTPNSKAAAEAMEQYNIHAFDAQGNFVGMTELAGQLQAGLGDLTVEQRAMALETIFGSDAVRAASIIYDNGADGIAKWTANVDDAGYAAETSAIKLDNLRGDVEALKGALEVAFIEGGDDSQGMLRGVTQLATDTVNLTTEVEKADGVLGGLWNSAMSAVNPLGSLGSAYNGLKGEISGADEKTKDLDSTSKALTETTNTAAGGLDAQATATEGLGTALEDAEEAAESFKDLMDSLNAVLGGRADMRDYEAAVDDFTKALKENGNTFDRNTGKGRENLAMLDSIAGSALAVAENMGQADRRKFLTRAIADLRTMGERMGLPKSEIKILIGLLREAHQADVKPKVEADTSRAMQSFREVDQYLSALNGKTATTYVNTVSTVTGPKGAAIFGEADGGVLDFYANGGMRENHVAQIAPAGAWRVWAEPETGGEAYIPLAESKRERSIDIWEDVGSRLGVQFQRFAAGGTTGDKKKRKRNFDESEEVETEAQRERREAREAREADRVENARAAELERLRVAEEAEAERVRIAEEAAEQQRAFDAAVLEGQTRAWDMATDAAKSQVDAAQAMVDSVKANMDRLGQAATAAFESPIFTKTDRRSGLWTGDNSDASGGWRGALTGDISGLRERSGLIARLSDPSMGLSAKALETLLRENDNAGIAAMLAAGEVDDYAALYAEREKLIGEVGTQAGMAGYGTEYAAASAQLVMTNEYLAAISAAIASARPITVTETVSAAALAAEIARLQAISGGY